MAGVVLLRHLPTSLQKCLFISKTFIKELLVKTSDKFVGWCELLHIASYLVSPIVNPVESGDSFFNFRITRLRCSVTQRYAAELGTFGFSIYFGRSSL